jgi:hypothetical protein
MIAAIVRHLRRNHWQRAEAMPAELRTADLVLSECPIWTRRPLPLSGQPDQVYEALNGDLIVVDSKTRRVPRVYLHDIVQLSVYRVILRHCDFPPVAGRPVRPYGYVRCQWGRAVRYLPARLLSEQQVFGLALRYLETRRQRPRPSP